MQVLGAVAKEENATLLPEVNEKNEKKKTKTVVTNEKKKMNNRARMIIKNRKG